MLGKVDHELKIAKVYVSQHVLLPSCEVIYFGANLTTGTANGG
jgi:hypothetical protein